MADGTYEDLDIEKLDDSSTIKAEQKKLRRRILKTLSLAEQIQSTSDFRTVIVELRSVMNCNQHIINSPFATQV
jgi:hypothetical protein